MLAIPSSYSKTPVQEHLFPMGNGEKRSQKKIGMKKTELTMFCSDKPNKKSMLYSSYLNCLSSADQSILLSTSNEQIYFPKLRALQGFS